MTKFTSLNSFMIMLIFSILYILMINYLHPIFILTLIIIYSTLICLLMSIWSFNFMYSIMLFLIMVSGLLIMFLYFTSLISNEQTKFMINLPLLASFFFNIMIIMIFMFKYSNHPPIYNYSETLSTLLLNNNLFTNILNIYSHPYSNLTMICILYLLLTLFSIIKTCSIKTSTLRKLN